jgi:2-C-methyl-D-erythritol 2,4-cyclodiphosphate synthase
MQRIGFGFDVHQLEAGRAFHLGGIEIDSPVGAKGHSDADVLIHSICDALLGAAALGDIGQHFPDTDPQYKGIDSKLLLREVVQLLTRQGYRVVNMDTTVVLEAPKIKAYVAAMRSKLAEVTGLAVDCISIKATTNETMGYIGRSEGVCAYAVVLIEQV